MAMFDYQRVGYWFSPWRVASMMILAGQNHQRWRRSRRYPGTWDVPGFRDLRNSPDCCFFLLCFIQMLHGDMMWYGAGIFTYIWVIYGVNAGKYSIDGAYGRWVEKTRFFLAISERKKCSGTVLLFSSSERFFYALDVRSLQNDRSMLFGMLSCDGLRTQAVYSVCQKKSIWKQTTFLQPKDLAGTFPPVESWKSKCWLVKLHNLMLTWLHPILEAGLVRYNHFILC